MQTLDLGVGGFRRHNAEVAKGAAILDLGVLRGLGVT